MRQLSLLVVLLACSIADAETIAYDNCLIACQTLARANLQIDADRAYQRSPEESAFGVWSFFHPGIFSSISVQTPFTYDESIDNAFFVLETSANSIDFESVYFWQSGQIANDDFRDLGTNRFIKISLYGTELKEINFIAETVPEANSFLLLLFGAAGIVSSLRRAR